MVRDADSGLTPARQSVICAVPRGNSSVGRARPCQGRGREFESRFPLHVWFTASNVATNHRLARMYNPHRGPSKPYSKNLGPPRFCFFRNAQISSVSARGCEARQVTRPGGRVVMQRPAKPRTPVRFRPWPPSGTSGEVHRRPRKSKKKPRNLRGFLLWCCPTMPKAISLHPCKIWPGVIADAPTMLTAKVLTAIAVRNASPREKPYKLAGGGGLYLEVMPTGAKPDAAGAGGDFNAARLRFAR